ncbi:MAG: hypothetical protein QXE05_02040 [Nitrososphaeria archaeon]
MYKLIYFFGPDGTGKTTHADLISTRLKLMGFRVWRTSVKQHHTIAYLLLKLMNLGSYDIQIINYYGFPERLAHRINRLWKMVEFFGLLPAVFYRVYLPMILGYVVVCDRYVLDSLVTLSYFLKEQNSVLGIFARFLVSLIPKSSLLVFFDADTEVIMLRKPNEPLSVELITYYKRMYRILLKIHGLRTEKVNTTDVSIQNVQKKIAFQIKQV